MSIAVVVARVIAGNCVAMGANIAVARALRAGIATLQASHWAQVMVLVASSRFASLRIVLVAGIPGGVEGLLGWQTCLESKAFLQFS